MPGKPVTGYEKFLYYIHNCVVNVTLSKIKNFTKDHKRRWKDTEVRYGGA